MRGIAAFFRSIKPSFYLRVSLFLPVVFLLIAGSPVITMIIARHQLAGFLTDFLSFGVGKWLMFLRFWAMIGGAAGLILAGIALKMSEEKRMKAGIAICLNTCVLVLALGMKYSTFMDHQATLADNGVQGILSQALSNAAGSNNNMSQTFTSVNTAYDAQAVQGNLDEQAIQQIMVNAQALAAEALKNGLNKDMINSLLNNLQNNSASGRNNGASASLEQLLGSNNDGK